MKFVLISSFVAIFAVCDANAVYMTAQIQNLLNQKQDKISALEECDGKRKGFMIAGISTIGLTAVGIGGNIALADKSNQLSTQIIDKNRELEQQQSNLANINSQISDARRDKARQDCEGQDGKEWTGTECVDKSPLADVVIKQPVTETPQGQNVVAAVVPATVPEPDQKNDKIDGIAYDDYKKCTDLLNAGKPSAFSSNGTSFWTKSMNGLYCNGYNAGKGLYYYKKNPCNQSRFSTLTNGEWIVALRNGKTIRGTSMCSTTKGTAKGESRDGITAGSDGLNCWCKLTQSDLSDCLATKKFSWMFIYNMGTVDAMDIADFQDFKEGYGTGDDIMPDEYYRLGQNTCPWDCAYQCGLYFFENGDIRGLHGIPFIQQYGIQMHQ